MKRRVNETDEEYRARNNAYMAEYRKKHGTYKLSDAQKQKAKERRIVYYAENKEHILANRKKYYYENKQHDNARNKLYRQINFEALRERELKRKYGIDASQYSAMYKSQNGLCAICFSDNNGKNLDVDHCHNTGKIRGLLCRSCNVLIGHARNEPEILHLAADYLMA